MTHLTIIASRTLPILTLLTALLLSTATHAEIEIDGIDGELREAVLTGLSFPGKCDQPRWMIRYRFRSAERDIRQVLETFGYYNATIESGLREEDGCLTARFSISAGPVTTYRDVNVTITGDGEPFSATIAQAAPGQGDAVDHAIFEAFKASLQEVATRFGFLDATFRKSEIVVDAGRNSARLDMTFDTGPRYVFGDIVYPNALLRDRVLARYHPFDSGDPYDTQKLQELYFGLVESGYFEDVVIRPLEPIGNTIPISVELIAGERRTRRAGIGVSTDFGPNLTYTQQNRLVNDRGHQTNLSLSLSPVLSEAGASYRIPHATERNGWYTFFGGVERDDTRSSLSTRSFAGVRRVSPRSGGWIETLYLTVVDDRFEIGGIEDATTHFIPGIQYTKTSASSVANRTQRGYRFDVELLGASESLGSSTDLATLKLEGRLIHTLAGDFRLLSRFRTGLTETDDFDRLPPRTRFFSGGDARLRGFDLDAVGIVDDQGLTIGGDRLLEYSLEVDHGIAANWALAVFTDGASVSRDSFSTDFKRSIGIGIRWYSPVGPIRVDVGRPVEGGDGVRLHISLGPEI